jgi:hypothetical protein
VRSLCRVSLILKRSGSVQVFSELCDSEDENLQGPQASESSESS